MTEFYIDRQIRYRALYHGDSSKRSIFWTNGFLELPKLSYQAFLRFIHRSGRILDLGCGNGLLLRFLYEQSPHALEPFGIDFLKESIAEAQQVVLPAFANHFRVANIARARLKNSFFDLIIIDLYHIHDSERETVIERFRRKLSPGGRLIVYSYDDSTRALGMTTLVDFNGMHNQLIGAMYEVPGKIAIAYLER